MAETKNKVGGRRMGGKGMGGKGMGGEGVGRRRGNRQIGGMGREMQEIGGLLVRAAPGTVLPQIVI
jgi:hypothetical protein